MIALQHCAQKELESLIGHLQHACKAIPQGRTFLQRMINLLSACQRDDHPLRLNQDFCIDLSWWCAFFHSWDGFSFLLSPSWLPYQSFVSLQMPKVHWDTVPYWIISGLWVNGPLFRSLLPIVYKELLLVVVASHLQGHCWAAQCVEFFVLTIWRWAAYHFRAHRRILTCGFPDPLTINFVFSFSFSCRGSNNSRFLICLSASL